MAQTLDRRIYVIGDSVVLGARDAVIAALPEWTVTVDAHQDLSLFGALDILTQLRPEIGDIAVVELGYDDGANLVAFRDHIDRAMAILAGVRTVVWLDQRQFAPGRDAMNAELRAAQDRYPNLRVVDWNAVVAAAPDSVYADGIHLTPAGQARMAQVIRAAVVSAATTTTTTSPSRSSSKRTTRKSRGHTRRSTHRRTSHRHHRRPSSG